MELQYNEPLYDEVLETTVFFAPVIVNVGKKIFVFASPLAIRYIEVPLYYISRGMLQAEFVFNCSS